MSERCDGLYKECKPCSCHSENAPLKAEVEKIMDAERHEQARLINERDLWRERAEKCAEVLTESKMWQDDDAIGPDFWTDAYKKFRRKLEEALSLFPPEGGKA